MKKLKPLVIAAIIFNVILINTSVVFCIDGRIYKNIYINDINVSKLTKDECREKLEAYLEKNRHIKLKFKEEDIIIDKNKLGIRYKVEEAVEKAYNVGRDEDIISDFRKKLSLSRGEREVILLEYVYDASSLDELLDRIEEKAYIKPVSATAEIVNNEIILTREHYGQAVEKEKLKKIILNIVEFKTTENNIPIEVLEPRYKYDSLKCIDTVLGSYETKFNPSNENRASNIKVAANSTSNIIIDVNQEFSFNNILAKSGVRNKLKEAPIILNGKSDKGIGGGICQVSTTIYNAALYAGMDIVDISNHSIPSFYVEKGRDATVSQGSIDFIFKNNNKTPIIVYNEIIGNILRTKIYGSRNYKQNIEITTDIIEVINNNKICKLDSNLEKGKTLVEQKGRLGYRVKTFRLYKNNEVIVKRELINTSYYPPCDEIILTGINKNYDIE